MQTTLDLLGRTQQSSPIALCTGAKHYVDRGEPRLPNNFLFYYILYIFFKSIFIYYYFIYINLV